VELQKLTESERQIKDMISSLNSKTQGTSKIKELELKVRDLEE
jgi:polyhydroxyalkanoate synthesis regulator phasin